MTLWVITRLEIQATPGSQTLVATTDLPTHLHLTTSPLYPAKALRYKLQRGIRRPCGFYLRWHQTTCGDQDEPGDTLTHTLHSPQIMPFETLWACLGESCPPAFRFPSTAPFPLTGTPITMLGFITTNHTSTQSIPSSTNTVVSLDQTTATGGANPPTRSGSTITFPVAGTVVITACIYFGNALADPLPTPRSINLIGTFAGQNLEEIVPSNTGAFVTGLACAWTGQVQPGDTVQLAAYQASGHPINLFGAADGESHLSACYVSV